MPLYGLMTADGRVVTEPVYTDIYLLAEYSPGASDDTPFLILRAGNPNQDAMPGGIWDKGAKITVAAPDGSWVLEEDYTRWAELSQQRLALAGLDGSVTIINSAGETLITFSHETLASYLGEDYYFGWSFDARCYFYWLNGIGCISVFEDFEQDPDNYQYSLYLNPNDGSVSRQPPEGFSFQGPEYVDEPRREFPGYKNANALTDPFTGAVYYRALQEDEDWVMDMLDASGRLLLSACERGFSSPSWVYNGCISQLREDAFCYYDLEGNCVFRYPLRSNTD